jgi:hypothetical protein
MVRGLLTATNVFIAIAACLLSIAVLAIEDVGVGFGTLLASVFLIDLMFNVLVPIARHANPHVGGGAGAVPGAAPTPKLGPDPDYGI